jgi:hypothetical protein
VSRHPEPGTPNLEPVSHRPPAISHQPPESDTPMTATYVRVIAVEIAIIIALWFFGRMFS